MTYRLPIAGRTRCEADWNAMIGDSRVRHCGTCNQHVYNLSAMTADEVTRLAETVDGPCVRFFTRSDGTLITRDCVPPPSRPLWNAIQIAAALAIGGTLGAAAIARMPTKQPEAAVPWIEHKYMYTGKYEGLRLHCTRYDLPKPTKFE